MEEDYYNHTFNEIRKSCAGEYLDFSNSTTESIEPLRSAALHGVYSAYIYAEEAQRLLVRHKELYADQPIFMYLPFQVRKRRVITRAFGFKLRKKLRKQCHLIFSHNKQHMHGIKIRSFPKKDGQKPRGHLSNKPARPRGVSVRAWTTRGPGARNATF